MPNQVSGEAGASSGPMGSVPFGQGQQLEQVQQAGNQAARQQPAAPGGPGTSPASAAPSSAAQPPAPDAQPQAGVQPFQFNPQDFPLTARGQQMPAPWREQLQMWAQHPQANDALRRLARLANRGRPAQ